MVCVCALEPVFQFLFWTLPNCNREGWRGLLRMFDALRSPNGVWKYAGSGVSGTHFQTRNVTQFAACRARSVQVRSGECMAVPYYTTDVDSLL